MVSVYFCFRRTLEAQRTGHQIPKVGTFSEIESQRWSPPFRTLQHYGREARRVRRQGRFMNDNALNELSCLARPHNLICFEGSPGAHQSRNSLTDRSDSRTHCLLHDVDPLSTSLSTGHAEPSVPDLGRREICQMALCMCTILSVSSPKHQNNCPSSEATVSTVSLRSQCGAGDGYLIRCSMSRKMEL